MRLQQILANLLGNALKFTHHGEIRVNVLLLERNRNRAKVRFSVRDTGIGMALEDREKLFQPFSQADTSITRRFGGTGLGLAISYRLLQLMGSDFHVDSAPDKGTTFSFDLVLEVVADTVGLAAPQATATSAGKLAEDLKQLAAQLEGANILVVEDNTINQVVVKQLLVLSGMHVDVANHGREALQLLERNEYDAVLMDVHMPEMGGIEATTLLRRMERLYELPVIALSAGVTEEERAKCRECGMNDFVAKPVKPQELISVLCRWVARDGKG